MPSTLPMTPPRPPVTARTVPPSAFTRGGGGPVRKLFAGQVQSVCRSVQ